MSTAGTPSLQGKPPCLPDPGLRVPTVKPSRAGGAPQDPETGNSQTHRAGKCLHSDRPRGQSSVSTQTFLAHIQDRLGDAEARSGLMMNSPGQFKDTPL